MCTRIRTSWQSAVRFVTKYEVRIVLRSTDTEHGQIIKNNGEDDGQKQFSAHSEGAERPVVAQLLRPCEPPRQKHPVSGTYHIHIRYLPTYGYAGQDANGGGGWEADCAA